VNLYLYCRAGPVTYVDPDGMEAADPGKRFRVGLTKAALGAFRFVPHVDAAIEEFDRQNQIESHAPIDAIKSAPESLASLRDADAESGGVLRTLAISAPAVVAVVAAHAATQKLVGDVVDEAAKVRTAGSIDDAVKHTTAAASRAVVLAGIVEGVKSAPEALQAAKNAPAAVKNAVRSASELVDAVKGLGKFTFKLDEPLISEAELGADLAWFHRQAEELGDAVEASQARATPPKPAATSITAAAILSDPASLWGRSAREIAEALNAEGLQARVRQSTRGSGRAEVIDIQGHGTLQQIRVHPGGGRHGGAYVNISTSTQGKIKVVDPKTYVPLAGEKARIVPKP